MKFPIRDDDISYWTTPEELEIVYKEIWAKGIPVSFSVIPFAVKSYNCGDRNNFYQEIEPKAIGENKSLVDFLKEKLNKKEVSLMLHGYSHLYKVAKDKSSVPIIATKENLDILRRNKHGKFLKWYGEYNWKPYEQLKKETKIGKEYLQDLFHTKISVFVPPGNDISKDGVKAVAENGLNISGTMYLSKFNRPLNFYSVKNWIIKLWWRLRYNKVYPYVMNYRTYKELYAYILVPGVTLEMLNEQLEFCVK